jgi:D-amino-acid dehydrogenase
MQPSGAGVSFLRECLPRRAARNTAAIASLAIYSRQQLRALRQDTGLRYESREGGILHLFEKAAEAARLPQRLDELEALGIHGRILSPAEAVEVEPALAALGPRLAGALHGLDDESGNAHLFCRGSRRWPPTRACGSCSGPG